MHSKEKLENIQKEVSDAVPKLAEVLFRAICFTLGQLRSFLGLKKAYKDFDIQLGIS
jgi:hypothetical protein